MNDREITFWEMIQSAFLMKACSWLESTLALACHAIEDDQDIPKTANWSDVRDKGVKKARTYLAKNFCLDLSRHRHWSRLLQTIEIRNCFVHCGGRASLVAGKKRRAITEAIKQTRGASLVGEQIMLEDEFFDELFASIREFWQDFESALTMNHIIGPGRDARRSCWEESDDSNCPF